MSLSLQDWHERFKRQASWTRELRNHLYQRSNLQFAGRILDVGSGTGALESDFKDLDSVQIHSLDINHSYLEYANRQPKGNYPVQGDGHMLPYVSGVFDISLCHFLLMWVHNPDFVLAEMRRVTRPGGSILALAEPDYGRRIDFPGVLAVLGDWQVASLRKQGANPVLGRSLPQLFIRNQIQLVQAGVLGGQWDLRALVDEFKSEWDVLEHDIDNMSGAIEDKSTADRLKIIDLESRQVGGRVLFVPTFYVWGRVA